MESPWKDINREFPTFCNEDRKIAKGSPAMIFIPQDQGLRPGHCGPLSRGIVGHRCNMKINMGNLVVQGIFIFK